MTLDEAIHEWLDANRRIQAARLESMRCAAALRPARDRLVTATDPAERKAAHDALCLIELAYEMALHAEAVIDEPLAWERLELARGAASTTYMDARTNTILRPRDTR